MAKYETMLNEMIACMYVTHTEITTISPSTVTVYKQ
jgi:hypothetical protein